MTEKRPSKSTILVQLDPDAQASVFDSVVAVDSGAEHLFRHANVTEDQVEGLVHGAMFTRGPQDLHRTAIFVGGANVARGEQLLERVIGTFFGPLRCSVMLDANGANTTAAAAVLAAERHVPLTDASALVLGGTGPVGLRAARLLAGQGASVKVASRSEARAEEACQQIAAKVADASLTPVATGDSGAAAIAADVDIIIAAGAAGVELLSAADLAASHAKVAVDLNAVPPLGLGGVDVMDKAAAHHDMICYGAIGVGGDKMKIHKAAIASLFESNDKVLDAEEIFALGQTLLGG